MGVNENFVALNLDSVWFFARLAKRKDPHSNSQTQNGK